MAELWWAIYPKRWEILRHDSPPLNTLALESDLELRKDTHVKLKKVMFLQVKLLSHCTIQDLCVMLETAQVFIAPCAAACVFCNLHFSFCVCLFN